MLWLGKKIFKFREKLTIGRGLMAEDEEKPFLDHLEDLRKTLMKIIITLVVAMIGCFAFHKQLIDLTRYPITKARVDVPETEHLPKGFTNAEEWPVVMSIAHGLLGLDEAQRKTFLAHALGEKRAHLEPFVRALVLHHAALDLPEEAREAFVQDATGGDASLLALVNDMASRKVDASFERGPQKVRMFFSGPAQGFNLSMKLSLYAGVVIAFPLLLYFLLEFVVPGMKKEERRVLWPSMAVGFGLFLVGVSFAYLVVTPKALRFFVNYDRGLEGASDYRFPDYVSFVVQFTLIFGLCFELPVIVFALNKLGILSYQLMRRTRSYAVIIIVVVAAIITPTADLLNLSLLVVPMIFLYEISIWIAFFHDRRARKREMAEESAEAERRAQRRQAQMAAGYLEDPAHHSAPGEPTPAAESAGSPDATPPFVSEDAAFPEPSSANEPHPAEDPFHHPESHRDDDVAAESSHAGTAEPAPEETSSPDADGQPEGERHRD